MKQELNYIEVVPTILTVIDGMSKILLVRNKKEPYKGYWMLPSKMIRKDVTITDTLEECITEQTGLPMMHVKQGDVFGSMDRKVDRRVIGISYLGLIDSVQVELKQQPYSIEDMNWFSIDKLPKLAFDHEEIIQNNLEMLKGLLDDISTLKYLFPSDFTLPEIQRSFEMILGRELDRRNFRKRFIQHDLIEDTGDKTEGKSGRPARLYRFKEIIDVSTHY